MDSLVDFLLREQYRLLTQYEAKSLADPRQGLLIAEVQVPEPESNGSARFFFSSSQAGQLVLTPFRPALSASTFAPTRLIIDVQMFVQGSCIFTLTIPKLMEKVITMPFVRWVALRRIETG